MMEPFTYRAYSKKELALCYFPDSMPKVAVKHLVRWINHCQPLKAKLEQLDYKPSDKHFTPRQVRVIVEQLGEP